MDVAVALWKIGMVICGLSGDGVDEQGCMQSWEVGYFTTQEQCQLVYTFKLQEDRPTWVKSGGCEKEWVRITAGNWVEITDEQE